MAINITTVSTPTKAQAAPEATGISSVAAEKNRQVNVESRQAAAAEQAAAAKVKQQEPSSTEVKQAVSDINDYLQNINREMRFRVDDALPLGRSVVSIIDSETQEVIREFPSEEALALARRLQEEQASASGQSIEGMFISDQA